MTLLPSNLSKPCTVPFGPAFAGPITIRPFQLHFSARLNLTSTRHHHHLNIPPCTHPRCPPSPTARERSPAHGLRTNCPSRGRRAPPRRPAMPPMSRLAHRSTPPSRAAPPPRPRFLALRRTGTGQARRDHGFSATSWSEQWVHWRVWGQRLRCKVRSSSAHRESFG